MTLAPHESPVTPVRTRETWVDVAKGAAILLVVLFHAGGLVPTTTTGGAAWAQVNALLASVRMPLFFLVSGLFVGKALAALPFRSFFMKKAWPPLYLFVLWGALSVALHFATVGHFGITVYDWLLMQATLWYMAGLSIHMTAAWALRRVPRAVQFTLTGLLSLPFAIFFPFELAGLGHIPRYLFFFLIGCYGRQMISTMVRNAGWGRALLLLFACGSLMVAALGLRVLDIGPQELQAVFLFALMPLCAVPLTLILCRFISASGLGRWLAWLGRHTLPVFLIHPFALQVLGLLGAERLSEVSVVAFVMPLALTVAAMLLSVLAWHFLEMYLPWLFAPTLDGPGRHHSRRAKARQAAGIEPETGRTRTRGTGQSGVGLSGRYDDAHYDDAHDKDAPSERTEVRPLPPITDSLVPRPRVSDSGYALAGYDPGPADDRPVDSPSVGSRPQYAFSDGPADGDDAGAPTVVHAGSLTALETTGLPVVDAVAMEHTQVIAPVPADDGPAVDNSAVGNPTGAGPADVETPLYGVPATPRPGTRVGTHPSLPGVPAVPNARGPVDNRPAGRARGWGHRRPVPPPRQAPVQEFVDSPSLAPWEPAPWREFSEWATGPLAALRR